MDTFHNLYDTFDDTYGNLLKPFAKFNKPFNMVSIGSMVYHFTDDGLVIVIDMNDIDYVGFLTSIENVYKHMRGYIKNE